MNATRSVVLLAAGLLLGGAVACQEYSMLTATHMIRSRAAHTATSLDSGKVLVTGGRGQNTFLSSAELYDPAKGTWSNTGSMFTSRAGHTATRLPSGKVLVTGGTGVGAAGKLIDQAELYDPVQGTWALTGSMSITRAYHTATLLPDGRVLVTGGVTGASTVSSASSAELYDPEKGTWSPAASMVAARHDHTATLLANGRVLVVGGANETDSLASVEVYDPESNTWLSTGGLGAPRTYHTATPLPGGRVLVVGGSNGSSALSSAELYDPASGSWSSTATMSTVRAQHTATALSSGKVLVAGGFDLGSTRLSTSEVYDPASGTWSPSATMTAPRSGHTATPLSEDKVLIAGGHDGHDSLMSVELLAP